MDVVLSSISSLGSLVVSNLLPISVSRGSDMDSSACSWRSAGVSERCPECLSLRGCSSDSCTAGAVGVKRPVSSLSDMLGGSCARGLRGDPIVFGGPNIGPLGGRPEEGMGNGGLAAS